MKRRLFIVPFTFFLLSNSTIREVNDAPLKIKIINLRNNDGHVLLSLFKDGIGYPNQPEKSFRKIKLPISNNTAYVSFTNLPSGSYSVAILHDENDDEKMNKTFLGLPKEGYGFSNNVMGTFGPPSLRKASFLYLENQPKDIIIQSRY